MINLTVHINLIFADDKKLLAKLPMRLVYNITKNQLGSID